MTLYYYPLCQISVKLRMIILYEKIQCKFITVNSRNDFSKLKGENTFFNLPVFIDKDLTLYNGQIIRKYLENKTNKEKQCWTSDSFEFFIDVDLREKIWKNIVYERTLKIISENNISPDFEKIKTGIANIKIVMPFFEKILENNSWLNGESFSFLDISFFSLVLCLDYCSQMPWFSFPEIKKWYGRIKSKKEFEQILKDRITTVNPPSHFEKIDF